MSEPASPATEPAVRVSTLELVFDLAGADKPVRVVDAWYGHAVALRPRPFHPIGMPASLTTNGAEFGIDESAAPTLDEILAVRAGRIADLRVYLAEVTQEELHRVRGPNTAVGCPPPAERTAVECLQVIFRDEWAHLEFANRDLAILQKEYA